MTRLDKELQKTIRNLEKLRDLQNSPSDEISLSLDILYEQQLDLIDAAIKKKTKRYKKATEAMKEAAKKTKKAIDNLEKIEQVIETVANAIGKITKLLSKIP